MESIKVYDNRDFIFTLCNDNIDKKSESVKFDLDINPIKDNEKKIYTNRNVKIMNLNFYIPNPKDRDSNQVIDRGDGIIYREKYTYNDNYSESFGSGISRLGYNFPSDISKKNYNKSNIVFEFYTDKDGLSEWLGSEVIYFSDLGTYTDNITKVVGLTSNGSPSDIDVVMHDIIEPTGVLNIGNKFLNELYGYRNFSNYLGAEDSILLYYKIILQNAKNGKRYYMIKGKEGAIDSRYHTDDDLYNDIIFYRDGTFEIVGDNVMYFKELILT